MGRRVTIMIDDSLDKKIRQIQTKIIEKENSTYSYSKAVNDLLRKALQIYKNIFLRNSTK